METIRIGIEGIEKLFIDGLPRKSNLLVYGKPGCGKTLFGLEFIYRGIRDFEECGVYVTFDQTREKIVMQCEKFGWDIQRYISKGKVSILSFAVDKLDREVINKIMSEVQKIKAKRLVIDTITLLALSKYEDKYTFMVKDKVMVSSSIEQFIYSVITTLNSLNTTNMYLAFSSEDENTTQDKISEYLCDGIINLRIRKMGKAFIRTIEIMKMRRSNHLSGIHNFCISEKGIVVEG
jgi:circadian clock protein KaiC